MLPDIVLDDRRFQELVSEARTRIARTCPEWTEHNVSDPGITLIELFAWMTEMLIYRTNRIPDKLHVALLNLLGMRLEGPACASAEVEFRLAGPAQERIEIPAMTTEVATVRTSVEPAIVFQVGEPFAIEPLRPAAYVVQRGDVMQDVGVEDGWARPTPNDQTPFGTPPQPGDALMIGFPESIARLTMRVDVEGLQARGAGVDPRDPPLRWEVSGGDGGWLPAKVLHDSTGGFNLGGGSTTLQLPAHDAHRRVAEHDLYWLCCRVHETTSSGVRAAYSNPPVIHELTAAPIGALLEVSHAVTEVAELIGTSEGLPAAVYQLRHHPVLPLEDREFLEVHEPGSDEWQPWVQVDSFAGSGPADRHFVLDLASGEVELGPAIRQADGHWQQYGAIPPGGAELRLSRYRHGGGRVGNVSAGTLTVLKTSIPGVATVNNPRAARGGVDAETLDSARARAALEFRTRHRAVTTEDFEFLSVNASPHVARAKCVPRSDGVVSVHLLPRIQPADRLLTLDELTPSAEMKREVAAYLDKRRLVGTTVQLAPTRLRGLSVVASIQASRQAELTRVQEDVEYALYCYLNPIIGGTVGDYGSGWPYGRTLNQGELFGVIHGVRGVEFVRILRIYDADMSTLKQAPKPAGSHIELEPDEVIASATHFVKAEYADD